VRRRILTVRAKGPSLLHALEATTAELDRKAAADEIELRLSPEANQPIPFGLTDQGWAAAEGWRDGQ
jgi:hypothetical protein